MRRALGVLFILSTSAACGGEPEAPDASTADGGAEEDGGAVIACARQLDCDDGLFCTVHRCMPTIADPRGCVLEDGPCGADETCDEAMDRCVAAVCGPVQDVDGDGHRSLACGGDDCDDDDDQAFPGTEEVCDAAGRNEDCVDATLAGDDDGDLDGDGFVSDACCNGGTCGDDCDDGDRAVFPGARELCNAIDDDCDGATDEDSTTLPLCPGGTCSAGTCNLPAWDRTFGGEGLDFASAVTLDERGNVYVVGTFESSVGFGAPTGPLVSRGSADIYVASYAADGSYRWVRQYGDGGRLVFASGIAFDSSTAELHFAAWTDGPIDFGDGASGTGSRSTLVTLDRDGVYVRERPLPSVLLNTIRLVAGDGVVAVGTFNQPFDFGGGTRTPPSGSMSGYVLRLDATGARLWDAPLFASDGALTPLDVAIAPDGGVLVVGRVQGPADFGDGSVVAPGGEDDLFVLGLDGSGSYEWAHLAGGPMDDRAETVAVSADGAIYVAGTIHGSVDLGDAGPSLEGSLAGSAFLATLSRDGASQASRLVGDGAGQSAIIDAAITPAGTVLVVGAASGMTDFGGGTIALAAPPNGAAVVIEYEPTLFHRSETVFQYAEFPAACPTPGECVAIAQSVAVGPGGTTVLGGVFQTNVDLAGTVRPSNGDLDGFLVRLAR